jgi:hypothetical protein
MFRQTNTLSLFHGGNTGSNPVGDAKSFQALSGKAPKSLGTFLGTS